MKITEYWVGKTMSSHLIIPTYFLDRKITVTYSPQKACTIRNNNWEKKRQGLVNGNNGRGDKSGCRLQTAPLPIDCYFVFARHIPSGCFLKQTEWVLGGKIPDSLLLEFLAKSFHGLLCSGSKGWQGIQSGLILAQLPNKTNLSLSEPPVQQYIILQAAKSIKLQLAKRLRCWNIKRNHQLPSKGSQTSGFKLRFYLPTTTIFLH